jgi:exonuclease III
MDHTQHRLTNNIVIILLMMANLNICAWNMRSATYAGPYISELCSQNDIIFTAEHRMYDSQLNKLGSLFPGFCTHAKASSDLDNEEAFTKAGHCGVCIAWKQHLSPNVRIIKAANNDRICAIQLSNIGKKKCNLYIIGVYLPQQRCQISDFDTHLNQLEMLVKNCKHDGEVIVIGDFNCHFGPEHGSRFWGKTTLHAKHVKSMLTRQSLCIIDGDAAICEGPNYTFYVDGVGCSYIDHCIVSQPLVTHIQHCMVHPDSILNTSDHLAITLQL